MQTLLLAALLAFAQDTIKSEKGDITVIPIEHATFVLKGAGRTIFVDPVGGPELFKSHGTPDIILITDIHGDHMDPKTVAGVRSTPTVVIAPAAVAEKFGADKKFVTVLGNGQTTKLGDVLIEGIPMYNLTAARRNNHTKGRGNGYVVTLAGKRIYISGDTEDIPEMRALKDIDAAFVCMNLPYTMDVEQASAGVLAFKPKIVYPYHYRGKEDMSDVEQFKKNVAADKEIEVRLLKWYK